MALKSKKCSFLLRCGLVQSQPEAVLGMGLRSFLMAGNFNLLFLFFRCPYSAAEESTTMRSQ